jgi:serine/threonine-protein kinase
VGAKLLDIDAGGRQRIDRYELIGEIASGGMATVYLARLTGVGGFQRFVAIKRLHPHLAGEAEFVEMFLDEARLAAGIHHPNVVPILEVGATPNGYYLVMEYVEGETLARLLARAAARSSRLPTAITVRLAVDMLSGLHAAHELRDETGELAGLVHRDVSPQNVLVGSDGITRITDFGVARAASRLTATRVGQLKGKIAYMAPEQAAGMEDVDRRADVFACGVVLWEAFAHKRLFKAENEAITLSRVMSEPVPQLHVVAPHIPRAISDVIMKALERDVRRRYPTCAEMGDALERAGITTGNLATARDLQAYIQDILGTEIQQQRDAVRAWIARSDSTPRPSLLPQPPGSSVSVATMALTSADPTGVTTHTGGARSNTGKLIGLVALAVVGAVAFLGYKKLTARELPSTGVSAATPEATALPVQSALPLSPPPASASATPDTSAATGAPSAAASALAPAASAVPTSQPAAPAGGQYPRRPLRPARADDEPAPAAEPKPPKKKDPDDDLNRNPYR